MGNSDTLFSLSSLLCEENEASLLKEEDDESTVINLIQPCLISENEDEYIENLFKRETDFGSQNCLSSSDENCLSTKRSWFKSVRLNAIEWILNARAIFGFQFHTVYLSMIYFDRFLSRRLIDEGKLWAIRLLSVACLSLAAKMEELNPPALSEYPVVDFYFENRVIQRMELLVLSALEWNMGSVTPFAYLHYFIKKFCGESKTQANLSIAAAELIVAVTKEINLMDHRASIIASAAVLAALDDQLTKPTMELKINAISSWGSRESERVFSCYNLMQEIGRRKIKTPELVISPNFLSMHSNSSDVAENFSFTSAAGTKKRLTFGDSENYLQQKRNRIN